jgi:hypothetical protein
MKSNEQPRLLVTPFAAAGLRNEIPDSPSAGSSPNAASLRLGFPDVTMRPAAFGGKPADGKDVNGALYLVSLTVRWVQAGGMFSFDQGFAAAPEVDGYPKGAVLLAADGKSYWSNQADSNKTNPDATDGSARNWVPLNADWNATSGPGRILNKPTIPAAQVNADWAATDGLAEILNKPSIGARPGDLVQLDTNGALPAVDGSRLTGISAEQVGADESGAASSAVQAHEAKTDPHQQYLTKERSDVLYDPFGAASKANATRITGYPVDGTTAADGKFLKAIEDEQGNLNLQFAPPPVQPPSVLLAETVYSTVAQSVDFTAGSPDITCSLVAPLVGSPVVFSSTGELPSRLISGETYFVVSVQEPTGLPYPTPAVRFQVSATPWGSSIKFLEAGTGEHFISNPPWRKATNNPALVEAELVGGGGSGGCGNWGTTGSAVGGGAGGYVWFRRIASALPDIVPITVGAGGPGPTAYGANGSPGGTTSFGNVASAGGGVGGQASLSSIPLLGTAGGTAVGGDLNLRGQGSAPVVATNIGNYTSGGSSKFGAGGMGCFYGSGPTPFSDGSGRGSGGAGGYGRTKPTESGGGAAGRGAPGIVIVREWS